jgi:hypothetical protein
MLVDAQQRRHVVDTSARPDALRSRHNGFPPHRPHAQPSRTPGFAGLVLRSGETQNMIRRAKRILAGVAIGSGVLAGGIWLLIHTLGEHDELYQGKLLSYWLKQVESQEAAVSNQARGVLDTQVIPQLTETMFRDTNDSSLRLGLIERGCLKETMDELRFG